MNAPGDDERQKKQTVLDSFGVCEKLGSSLISRFSYMPWPMVLRCFCHHCQHEHKLPTEILNSTCLTCSTCSTRLTRAQRQTFEGAAETLGCHNRMLTKRDEGTYHEWKAIVPACRVDVLCL